MRGFLFELQNLTSIFGRVPDRVRGRVRLTGALLSATVLLAPAGLAAGREGPGPAETRSEIQELLDRRADAVLAGDQEAFMATVSRRSEGFVERQRRLFAGWRSIPLGSYELEVSWERYGDVATGGDRARYPDADQVVIPLTEERYRLRSFDARAAVEDLFYTFIYVDGRWLIAEDTDTDDLTLYTARHPWDYGPLDAERTGHFLLLTPSCSGCPDAPPGAVELADSALDRVNRYWSPRWRKRVALVIPPGADELKRMIQATFDVGDFVAFAYSTVDIDDGIDYTGHRIILNPDAFIARPADSTRNILAHELLHVAARDLSGPFVPTFVEEGLAEYVGRDADTSLLDLYLSEARKGAFDGRLPEDFQFSTGSGEDIFRSYQKAYSATQFFVARWGIERFIAFYRTLGHAEIAAGTTRYHLDRALRKSVGTSLDTFERAWAGSIVSP